MGEVFSLTLWERAGVRASVRTFPPLTLTLSLEGEGTDCARVYVGAVFSLSLWERAGVRASVHTFPPLTLTLSLEGEGTDRARV
ncbi:hypothetical protein DBY68_007305 [Pseudocitrobacter sp. RIT415]|nr:hypothetical protein DBY68_007305 [Pseudocitrobacter sp. RIT 415]